VKLKHQYKIRPSIPLASMADLAMLLLVFFVVCGKTNTRSTLAIDPPLSLTGEELFGKSPVIVTINAAGETYLDGRLVYANELLDELEAILQNRRERAERTVLIEVDRHTSYKDYVHAVDAVNRSRGYVELRVKQ
jgi:biopolymer transport protein ExbD